MIYFSILKTGIRTANGAKSGVKTLDIRVGKPLLFVGIFRGLLASLLSTEFVDKF